ncbi:hypothetical protein [Pseudoxanthomonas sacheonensis]|uniref:Lipoprotein n=1 Tax=Pseudoxanthomonas sacheonensis TaxID=443615 RepID=A0ABU1RX06_9GAMM|nr:hypothetical protein [Pseudoxanthomonas sacheonensis]MDR6842435.1 hypothetical protein [Pseudoxanthomonas sacheonensis]
MKTLLRITALSLGLLLLVGCASTQKTTYRDTVPKQQVMEYTGHDARYMAMVEEMAKERGIQVVWVNPPRKHAPAVAAVE